MGVLGGGFPAGGCSCGSSGGGAPPTGPASGDLGGTYPNPTVAKLQARAVDPTAPGAGQTLAWDGAKWTPTTPSSTPSGAASGDLGGTYPGPNVIALRGVGVAATVPTLGQALLFDGTTWAPGSPLPTLVSNKALVVNDVGTTVAFADLALANTTGTLPANRGGTGLTASGAAGRVLRSDGIVWQSAALGVGDVTDAAPLASPALTGNPTAPTQLTGDNSTRIASTAFVQGALSAYAPNVSTATGILPIANGGTGQATASAAFVALAPAPGIAGRVLRSDGSVWQSSALAVADVAGAAPLSGPAFTGGPTAPTAAVGTSNAQIATTLFVRGELNSGVRASAGVEYFDHFIGSITTTGDLEWDPSSNGAGVSTSKNTTGVSGADGYVTISSGTAATGRNGWSRGERVAGQAPFTTPWTRGIVTLEWRVLIPVLPTGTDPTYALAMGSGNLVASNHWTDGIGVRIAPGSAVWTLASRSLGSDIGGAVAAASIGPTAAVWQVVVLELTSTTATLYAGATRAAALAAGTRATVTMAGATASPVAQMFKMNNTAGTVARLMSIDYAALNFVYTTPI